MKRGDVVTAGFGGAYGKPRPAIVIQSDRITDSNSVLICLVTSDLEPLSTRRRIKVSPSAANGLKLESQIMVEKIIAVPRAKCGKVIGRIEAETLERLNGALAYVVGLLDTD